MFLRKYAKMGMRMATVTRAPSVEDIPYRNPRTIFIGVEMVDARTASSNCSISWMSASSCGSGSDEFGVIELYNKRFFSSTEAQVWNAGERNVLGVRQSVDPIHCFHAYFTSPAVTSSSFPAKGPGRSSPRGSRDSVPLG